MPEQAAETRIADDLLSILKRIVNLAPTAGKRPIADALMRPQRVVKVDVGRHEEDEVLMSEDDEVIQALVLDRFDPALDEHVLIGCSRTGPNHSSARMLEDRVETGTEHDISITSDMIDAQERLLID